MRKAAETGVLPIPSATFNRGFSQALTKNSGIAAIAEYKRASPSRGIIREDLSVEDVAQQYAAAGASAISILTEEDWFKGDTVFLERAANVLKDNYIPLLRKDFIFDPVQVYATVSTPAAALLLIVRCTPDAILLRQLREQAESYGLDCVVEVFNAEDLHLARESGAKIIQVNARDLETLKVERKNCLRLIQDEKPQTGEIWIAASGMEETQHLREAQDAGFNAVLIGSSLMSAKYPGKRLEQLLADIQSQRNVD